MDLMGFNQFFNGFVNALTMVNLLACFFGALIGTIVGVLPGLGPTATMALMLPFTMQYGPAMGLIMMTGVWCGAQYGGSTTSILVNIPGESASVITCIDGYQMAKKGEQALLWLWLPSALLSPEHLVFWAFRSLHPSWDGQRFPSAHLNTSHS